MKPINQRITTPQALQQLELRFDFAYPQLYLKLCAQGMLENGTAGLDWITEQYPLLRQNPPLLLFANEFELMDFGDIESQMEEFTAPDHWMNIRPDLRFIPFAQNGAGDMYCFFLTGTQGDDIPVVLLWHDANRATYKAKNLQDFIFRSMLEAVADVEEAEYGLLDKDNFGTDLQNFLRTHQPYLSVQQQNVLKNIYDNAGADKPLISELELQHILQNEIGFEQMDQSFKYMKS